MGDHQNNKKMHRQKNAPPPNSITHHQYPRCLHHFESRLGSNNRDLLLVLSSSLLQTRFSRTALHTLTTPSTFAMNQENSMVMAIHRAHTNHKPKSILTKLTVQSSLTRSNRQGSIKRKLCMTSQPILHPKGRIVQVPAAGPLVLNRS